MTRQDMTIAYRAYREAVTARNTHPFYQNNPEADYDTSIGPGGILIGLSGCFFIPCLLAVIALINMGVFDELFFISLGGVALSGAGIAAGIMLVIKLHRIEEAYFQTHRDVKDAHRAYLDTVAKVAKEQYQLNVLSINYDEEFLSTDRGTVVPVTMFSTGDEVQLTLNGSMIQAGYNFGSSEATATNGRKFNLFENPAGQVSA